MFASPKSETDRFWNFCLRGAFRKAGTLAENVLASESTASAGQLASGIFVGSIALSPSLHRPLRDSKNTFGHHTTEPFTAS